MRDMRLLKTVVFVLCCVNVARAQYTLADAFPSFPAFSLPVECVRAGDGTDRMFIAEQRGRIFVINTATPTAPPRLFLDLRDSVSSTGGETGLLGLAFHPAYSSNGRFYVDYTSSRSGSLRSYVARYQVSASNPDSAVRSTGDVLLSIDQPFDNHNGGKIAFGPDGYLYISLGDGGSGNDPQGNGQNLSVLLAKILRIDVDSPAPPLAYGIPITNPFASNTQGIRREIFAFGLRNPWRFSFDAQTGALWAGDVGQGAREEIDTIRAGGNYGWRLMEGTLCTPGVNTTCADTAGLIRPLWEYPHSAGDASITGGYVYRGNTIPALRGKYIYADYSSGRIWALTTNGTSPATNTLLLDSPYAISSFGEDRLHELFVVAYSNGRLYKLTGPATIAEASSAPPEFVLSENFPNPFNPTTTIRYQIPVTAGVRLSVFDLLGREVALLVDETQSPGAHEVTFDAHGLASGVYLYRLRAGSFTQTRKMLVVL
jgi:glucose/arabinose dehydrogenase